MLILLQDSTVVWLTRLFQWAPLPSLLCLLPCLNSKRSSPMFFQEQGWSAASHHSQVWMGHWLAISALTSLSCSVVCLHPGRVQDAGGYSAMGLSWTVSVSAWSLTRLMQTLNKPWQKWWIRHPSWVTRVNLSRELRCLEDLQSQPCICVPQMLLTSSSTLKAQAPCPENHYCHHLQTSHWVQLS